MSYDSWGTPQWLFDILDEEFKFELDVCASKTNHKCERYITEKQDGLFKPWNANVCWCNPPYSNPFVWVQKAIREVQVGDPAVVVMLLKCDPSTKVFRKLWDHSAEIRLINHRIKFQGAKQVAPFPNFIAILRPYRDGPTIEVVDYREYIK